MMKTSGLFLFLVGAIVVYMWVHLAPITQQQGSQTKGQDGRHLNGKVELIFKALSKYNKIIMKSEKELSFTVPLNVQHKSQTLDAISRDYFEKMDKLKNCKTIFFNVRNVMFLKMFSPKLFNVHSNNCTIFRIKSIGNKDLLELKCTENPVYQEIATDSLIHMLNTKIFYNIQTGYFSSKQEGNPINRDRFNTTTLGYLHVLKEAYIKTNVDVLTNNTYISIVRCKKNSRPKFDYNSQSYNKVFIISQYWGGAYFHRINEELPRIVLALPFLLENEDIKIHVSDKTPLTRMFLKEIGRENRLVTNDVHARIAYIPGGSECGEASSIPINILSLVLRKGLEKEHEVDTIVLIKRSKKRWFGNHDSILKMLKAKAGSFHLQVQGFGDNPPLSVQETRHLFNRAVMVVGPHGAGFSNIIFSQPGTCIIEGLCYDEYMKLNQCYKDMAQILGHIYHGVTPSKQCMQTRPEDLIPHVELCLNKVR